ncbi:DUF2188 domain-containing protein [Paenibacillus xylanivorans]|uniref:DUF2188 domain-containing protein n=1 Tax=Paenibacillus xylanivorans TaxID=1705561 RepID=UPI001F1995EE
MENPHLHAVIPSLSLLPRAHDNIHVVPADSGWAIKEEGQSKSLATFRTKTEAVDAAKEKSEKQNIRAIIHNEDGQIASSIKP